jgi:putative membrane protein
MKASFLASALLAATILVPAAALAVQPDEFVRDTIRADSGEIVLAQLAQQRAMTPEVRDYAGMLVQDHTQSRDQFSRVAWMVHVRPDWRITSDQDRQQRKLQTLRGRDFDREFARMMVDNHNSMLREFRQEVSSHNRGKPAEIAARILPTLEHHLQMAVNLQARLEDRFAYGDHRDRGPGFGDRDHDGGPNGNPGWRDRNGQR